MGRRPPLAQARLQPLPPPSPAADIASQQLGAPGSARRVLPLAAARPRRDHRRRPLARSLTLPHHPSQSGLALPQQPELILPSQHDYGLSVKQMQVLGLTSDQEAFAARLPEVKAVSRRRCSHPWERARGLSAAAASAPAVDCACT